MIGLENVRSVDGGTLTLFPVVSPVLHPPKFLSPGVEIVGSTNVSIVDMTVDLIGAW